MWWRDSVVYQVYPRSFADSDGDGLGDLGGIRRHLDDIAELGVDAIWLSPFYRSPQADGGYDVSDHRDVDPRFGTLAEFDLLLAEARERGLRTIVDLVPNHTSERHRWFTAALDEAPGGVHRARYIFRDGRGEHGEVPPNDWESIFGGPAWERTTDADGRPGQWYLHLFAPEQPDLDWTNPEVADEFESIIRFWFDRGVDGFRIDVAHGLAKDPAMPDIDGRFEVGGLADPGHPHWDRDEVHDVYRRWRRVAQEYPGDRMFVAEAYLRSPHRLAMYVRDDELHTAFNFRFVMAEWDEAQLRDAIDRTIETHDLVGAPPTWVLSNHDVVRPPTRFGGGERGVRRARAAALLMLALPGAAYIYQGEELGLPEVEDLPDEVRQDPTFERSGGTDPGRDGSRVPLPWSGDRSPFGFSPPGMDSAPPWLPQPEQWARLTRQRQRDDPDSTLALYRDALRIRRSVSAADPDQRLEWLDLGEGVLAFRRPGGFASVTNLSADPVAVPPELGTPVLVSTERGSGRQVEPDATVWFDS